VFIGTIAVSIGAIAVQRTIDFRLGNENERFTVGIQGFVQLSSRQYACFVYKIASFVWFCVIFPGNFYFYNAHPGKIPDQLLMPLKSGKK
jgi:hypothetical protein